ncbi:GAF domain-containing protein [Bacteriovoracaceae bacterium]|nr:GAF domain-containing protein [Bacteriovoracaceae bacterium]
MQSQLRKEEIYQKVKQDLDAIFSSRNSGLMRLSTIACVLKQSFPWFYWVGFYLWDDKLGALVVGPYQGTLGCLEIPLGKGVCGSSLKDGRTYIVNNVHNFSNHIACDSKTNSEVVVPLISEQGNKLGVLDIDSILFDSFDDCDKKNLEEICHKYLVPFLPI